MRIIILVLATLIAVAAFGVSAGELRYARVQTYGMLPLDPERASAKGLSVNGLWAGFGMPEAVRSSTHVISGADEYPVRWSYPTMKDYIEASHEAGVLVPASVMSVAGHPLHRKRFPEMENGACVGADGKRSYWSEGDRSYFMCSNNPIYHNVLVTTATEAIDAGVDLIVIDEIQGNETCFYWSNQPGFCNDCLAAYRKHLSSAYTELELREKFDIEDLDTFDFVKRLDRQREKTWKETDRLFKELRKLQERLNFEERSRLVAELRTHMKDVGRQIPICGNVPKVGLLDWVEGHRLPGLKWATVLDFLAFENGDDGRDYRLPQGKWVGYERLAAAAFRLPSAILHLYGQMHSWELEFMQGKSDHSVYLYAMLAEANANGCHLVNYFQPRWFPETEPLWDRCFTAQKFILKHRDLFEAETETGARAAVLYVENEGQRHRTRSYLGMVQALAESNIPFDVLIDGGDGYVPVTLTADALRNYQLVVIPQALDLAPAQKNAIESYVSGGGKILTADPEQFGVAGGKYEQSHGEGKFIILQKNEVTDHGLCDLAEEYFYTYDDDARERISRIVRSESETIFEVIGADRTVTAYPYLQPREKRILIHLLNSDYDPDNYRMRRKKDIKMRVKRPEFYAEGGSVLVYSPDFPETGADSVVRVTPVLKGDFIELTVPTLDVYDVIVL